MIERVTDAEILAEARFARQQEDLATLLYLNLVVALAGAWATGRARIIRRDGGPMELPEHTGLFADDEDLNP